jgi:hypothetical protein
VSWETQSWAAKQRPGSASAKLVLLGLASCADANHCAYPSIDWLCEFSDLNRKTVIAALQRLEDGMFPLIEDTGERKGRTKQVKVYRLKALTIERASRLNKDPESDLETVPKAEQFQKRNSSGFSGKQSQNRDTEPFREPIPPLSPNGDNPPKPKKSLRSKGKTFQLPQDWQAPDSSQLPAEVAALVRQWPAGAQAVQLANFRSHWSEVDRRKRSESGWIATWASWLSRVHPEIMRAAKAGVTFEQIPAAGQTEAKPIQPVAEKALECKAAKAMHETLSIRLGKALYSQWLEPCALIADPADRAVTVHAPSDFAAAWIDQHYRGSLMVAAAAAGLSISKIKTQTGNKGVA